MSTTISEQNIDWDQVQEKTGKSIIPRLLIGGQSGTGKSSVLNALLGKKVYETDVVPCTRDNQEAIWESQEGKIITMDVPGFGEANAPGLEGTSYEQNIISLAELDAHIFLLVLECPDRALQKYEEFLELWDKNSFLSKIPVIIVVNKIDLMKPIKDQDLSNLNLDFPQTEKEKNIKKYLDYLTEVPCFQKYFAQGRVLPFSVGDSQDADKYGIEILKQKIYEALPDAAKTVFTRAANLKELRDQEAHRIIALYAGGCAAEAAIQPFPLADSLLMAPIQVAMIIHLGKIHHIEIDRSLATGLVGTLSTSLVAQLLFLNLVSFIPGIKQIIGPGIAFGMAYSMGLIVNELFAQGNLSPTKEELRALLDKYADEGRRRKKEYEQSRD